MFETTISNDQQWTFKLNNVLFPSLLERALYFTVLFLTDD